MTCRGTTRQPSLPSISSATFLFWTFLRFIRRACLFRGSVWPGKWYSNLSIEGTSIERHMHGPNLSESPHSAFHQLEDLHHRSQDPVPKAWPLLTAAPLPPSHSVSTRLPLPTAKSHKHSTDILLSIFCSSNTSTPPLASRCVTPKQANPEQPQQRPQAHQNIRPLLHRVQTLVGVESSRHLSHGPAAADDMGVQRWQHLTQRGIELRTREDPSHRPQRGT